MTLAVVSRMRIMQVFTGYDGPLAMVPWQVLIASYDRNGKPLEPQEMALVSSDKLGYLNQLVRLVPYLTSLSLSLFSQHSICCCDETKGYQDFQDLFSC